MTGEMEPTVSTSVTSGDEQHAGIATRTQIQLDANHLLTLSVRAGEALGSDAGTVWITIDNEPDDILLLPGDAHLVTGDCDLRVSAFDAALLTVVGRGPLHYRDRSAPSARIATAWRFLVKSMPTLRTDSAFSKA